MTTTIAVECDATIAEELATRFRELGVDDLVAARKNHLDGALETIVQVFEVATPLITALSPIIVAYISRIRRVKVGDVELENPTPELLKQVLSKRTRKKR